MYPAHWDTWEKWGRRGWADAQKCHDMLVEKGLTPVTTNNEGIDYCDQNNSLHTSLDFLCIEMT